MIDAASGDRRPRERSTPSWTKAAWSLPLGTMTGVSSVLSGFYRERKHASLRGLAIAIDCPRRLRRSPRNGLERLGSAADRGNKGPRTAIRRQRGRRMLTQAG
jgi:hypothetical protein